MARTKERRPRVTTVTAATRGLERAGNALRFKVPDEGSVVVRDLDPRRRGVPCCPSIEDFVVVKSNGGPLFVLANVVDDRSMAHHPRDPR